MVAINKKENIDYNIRAILGVFNSKPINYYYVKLLKSTKKVFSEIQTRQIRQLLFPNIDLKNKSDKEKHDEIVKYVDLLLKLNGELRNAKLQSKVEQIQERIAQAKKK